MKVSLIYYEKISTNSSAKIYSKQHIQIINKSNVTFVEYCLRKKKRNPTFKLNQKLIELLDEDNFRLFLEKVFP